MNWSTFDSDAPDTSDEDYFAFVEWLSERTAAELRQAKDNPSEVKNALWRYWKQGYQANLTPSELIDFLGVSTPSILERAGFDEEEGDVAMAISDALTDEEINNTLLD